MLLINSLLTWLWELKEKKENGKTWKRANKVWKGIFTNERVWIATRARSRKVPSRVCISRKVKLSTWMRLCVRRLIEDVLLPCYERRMTSREGERRTIYARFYRARQGIRERERERGRQLIREGTEREGKRFHTGYPLEGSGARDSHRRHARVACRYKRRRSYY